MSITYLDIPEASRMWVVDRPYSWVSAHFLVPSLSMVMNPNVNPVIMNPETYMNNNKNILSKVSIVKSPCEWAISLYGVSKDLDDREVSL
jgi:hypothetical protein